MIYTGYFANLGKMQKACPNLSPVSIALYPPKWFRYDKQRGFDVMYYRKLAPTADILREWKANRDVERYTERFDKEVLSHLSRDEVIFDLIGAAPLNADLSALAPEYNPDKVIALMDIVLLCYETPEKFCHRHLVADWLTRGGYKCEELYL